MYHTVFPSQMMVQIMSGQQTGGQCSPVQTHTLHINGVNALHQNNFTQYGPDISGHNRHRTMQMGSHYPLDLLLTGVDVPSLRHIEYMQSNNASSANWERRMGTCNNNTIIPSSNYNFKPMYTNTTKKQNWNNKSGRRSSYKNSFSHYETYNSDSGFSSRSPTPNKHHIDNSLTESSDERDSTSSLGGQGIKKHHRINSDNTASNKSTSNSLISSASGQQFYQSQRPVNYYHTTISTPRSHVQNYQNRRRYLPGRNSPPSQRPPKNRKFTGVLLPSYNVFPRYYIAPDRFLARSHLVEVTSTPDNLITGSIWDGLSQHIWSKFKSNQQTETTYRNKMMLWKYLYIHIKTSYPRYGLFLVGSTINGFGSDNSDVDMCLLVRHTEMDQRNEAVVHLEQILKCIKKCDFIEQLELIQAKVPIIRFRDSVQNLEVDLNCNNAVGIRNTHLLYCYSKFDWRVRPLILVVKLWAQCHDINNAKKMTISSYSLVLMVIHFLQCGVSPPILPCLQLLFAEKFGPHTDIHSIDIHEELIIPSSMRYPENHQSLGELLVEFFKYYVTFDFRQYAISVRLANKVEVEFCRRARSYKNDPHQWKYLCIEEPFDLTNTARSVYDPDVFARIMQIFNITFLRLKNTRDLSRIFEKIDPISPYIT